MAGTPPAGICTQRPSGFGDRVDLVGQYIGHTAPKTKEIVKKAMGGVLFIDEAYYLYRAENERDYGQEAIEILLQVMENQREDLVVILAGYADRMEKFFSSNPGFRSRIAHHIDFSDYAEGELLEIGELILAKQNYKLSASGREALQRYINAESCCRTFRMRARFATRWIAPDCARLTALCVPRAARKSPPMI